MSTVATPIQSVASALSGMDNPIALVDWISSFLKTLEKFHAVVDKIATVSIILSPASCLGYLSEFEIHPYVQGAWTILSSVSKVWPLRFAGRTI